MDRQMNGTSALHLKIQYDAKDDFWDIVKESITYRSESEVFSPVQSFSPTRKSLCNIKICSEKNFSFYVFPENRGP